MRKEMVNTRRQAMEKEEKNEKAKERKKQEIERLIDRQ